MTATALRILETSSRDEIAEALGHLCTAAKREQRIVGTEALPSKWDVRHGAIDELLGMLERAER